MSYSFSPFPSPPHRPMNTATIGNLIRNSVRFIPTLHSNPSTNQRQLPSHLFSSPSLSLLSFPFFFLFFSSPGCVIGKSGKKIAELRGRSGCNIIVEKEEGSTPNERIIVIRGTAGNIQTAIQLIRECIESYRPREGERTETQ